MADSAKKDFSAGSSVGLPDFFIDAVICIAGGTLVFGVFLLILAAVIRILLGTIDWLTNLAAQLGWWRAARSAVAHALRQADAQARTKDDPAHAAEATDLVRRVFGLKAARLLLRGIVLFGRGSFGWIWRTGLVVLGVIWFWNGILVFGPQVDETANTVIVKLELLYRVFLTLAPSGDLFEVEVDPSELKQYDTVLRANYLGFVVALWIAAPPVLQWFVRNAEPMMARYLSSGHHVVIGFGSAGHALMESLLKESWGALVVGIEIAPSSTTIERARERGAIILAADASSRNALEQVSPQRAATIFIATGEESRNLDLAGQVADIIEERLSRLAMPPEPAARPKVVAHVNDPILRQRQSRGEGIFSRAKSALEKKVSVQPVAFSSDESAVHLLVNGATQRAQETLAGYARLLPADRVHAVILGFDSIAEAIIRQILQGGLSLGLAPPRITVVVQGIPGNGDAENAPEADAARGSFRRRFPALAPYLEAKGSGPRIAFKAYDFSFVDEGLLDLAETEAATEARERLVAWLERPGNNDADALQTAMPCDGVTAIFICLGQDDRNLATAMAIQTITNDRRRWRAPIFLRLRADSGLARLLSDPDVERDLARVVHGFGTDREVCNRVRIFEPPELQAAWAAHAGYKLVERVSQGLPLPTRALRETAAPGEFELWAASVDQVADAQPSDSARGNKAWSELIRTYRASNLDQAVHTRVKLDALGYVATAIDETADTGPRCAPLNGPRFASFQTFDQRLEAARNGALEPISALARLEHERFMVERQVGGTSYGPERDNTQRRHPLLVPYDPLPEGGRAPPGGEQRANDEKAKDLGAALLTPYIAGHLAPPAVWSPQLRIGLIGLAGRYPLSDARGHLDQPVSDLLPALRRAFATAHAKWLGQEPDDLPESASHVAPLLISSLAPGAELALAEAGLDALRPTRSPRACRPTPRVLIPKPVPFADRAADDAMADGLLAPEHGDTPHEMPYAELEAFRAQRATYITSRTEFLAKRYERPAWRLAPGDVWEVDLMPPGVPDRMARLGPPNLKWRPDEPDSEGRWDPRVPGVPAVVQEADPEAIETLAKRRRRLREDQIRRGAAYVHERADWLIVVRSDEAQWHGADDAARAEVLGWRGGQGLPQHLSCQPKSDETIDVPRPRIAPAEDGIALPTAAGMEHDERARLTVITL